MFAYVEGVVKGDLVQMCVTLPDSFKDVSTEAQLSCFSVPFEGTVHVVDLTELNLTFSKKVELITDGHIN